MSEEQKKDDEILTDEELEFLLKLVRSVREEMKANAKVYWEASKRVDAEKKDVKPKPELVIIKEHGYYSIKNKLNNQVLFSDKCISPDFQWFLDCHGYVARDKCTRLASIYYPETELHFFSVHFGKYNGALFEKLNEDWAWYIKSLGSLIFDGSTDIQITPKKELFVVLESDFYCIKNTRNNRVLFGRYDIDPRFLLFLETHGYYAQNTASVRAKILSRKEQSSEIIFDLIDGMKSQGLFEKLHSQWTEYINPKPEPIPPAIGRENLSAIIPESEEVNDGGES